MCWRNVTYELTMTLKVNLHQLLPDLSKLAMNKRLTITAILIFLLIGTTTAGYAASSRQNIVGAPPYGPTFQQAVAAAGGRNLTLWVPAGTYPIKANFTVPANIDLRVQKGAVFTVAPDATLTLKGSLEAGPYQIFAWSGKGKIVLGSYGVTRQVQALWFGADPSGVRDSQPAIQMALDACYKDANSSYCGTVVLQPGTYLIHKRINLYYNVHLKGDNWRNTAIKIYRGFPKAKGVGYAAFGIKNNDADYKGMSMGAAVLSGVTIDLSAGGSTEYVGIWCNKSARRMGFYDIQVKGAANGNQIGMLQSKYVYNDDGTPSTKQATHNSLVMERCIFYNLFNWKGALVVEHTGDVQGQYYFNCLWLGYHIGLYYGGGNSQFVGCGWEPPRNGVKADGSGGSDRRIVLCGWEGTQFNNCYFDGGAGYVLVWTQMSGPLANNFPIAIFNGQNAGFNWDIKAWTNNVVNVARIPIKVTKTGPSQFKIAGGDYRASKYINQYIRYGVKIWLQTTTLSPNVFNSYTVISTSYDGTDTYVNVKGKLNSHEMTFNFYQTSFYHMTDHQGLTMLQQFAWFQNLGVGYDAGGTQISRIKQARVSIDFGIVNPGGTKQIALAKDVHLIGHNVQFMIAPQFTLPPYIGGLHSQQNYDHPVAFIHNYPWTIEYTLWKKESGHIYYVSTTDASQVPQWVFFNGIKGMKEKSKVYLTKNNQWFYDSVNYRLYIYSSSTPTVSDFIQAGMTWTPGAKNFMMTSIY